MTKQELRQQIRARNKEHRPTEDALDRLRKNGRFLCARTILLYSALPDEVPTQALLDELTGKGVTVLLPRVVDDTDMELRQYGGQHDLETGAFGIMEPKGRLYTDYLTIDVAVVPGMAFDLQGNRLGRGRGYYDRFLRLIPQTYKIGICSPWQIVEQVPSEEHDIKMDCVVY